MLSERTKRRINALIQNAGLVSHDDAEDPDENEKTAIALVRRVLTEFNSLEAAFYAVFSEEVSCAIFDLSIDDSRIEFLTDSLKSRDLRGRAALLESFLEIAEEFRLTEEDETYVLGYAHDLVENWFAVPSESDAEHFKKILSASIYNRWECVGDYAMSSQTLLVAARHFTKLVEGL